MIFHNSALAGLVPDDSYGAEDLARIERALGDHQTLAFDRLPSGLFAASSGGDAIASSGYGNVWVRDNIYVAYAHHVTGNKQVADVVRALITYFNRYDHRFDDIISGAVGFCGPAHWRIGSARRTTSIDRSRRSPTTGAAPNSTISATTCTSPTLTSRCSGHRPIS